MKINKSRCYLPINWLSNLFLLLLIFSSPIYGNIIIRSDTTWQKGEIINTGGSVQIEHGITLSVEGGVSISDNTRFLVLGNLLMIGSENEPVEVNNNSFCFHTDYNTPGYIEFNKVIMNGGAFSEAGSCSGYGYFSLMNSQFYEVNGFYLWYPVASSKIAKNIFVASGGLDVLLSESLEVSNNVFLGQPGVIATANYGNGLTVRYNSFLSLDKTALEIPEGYDSASMTADSNYYGTTDIANIEQRILDRNDSLTRASYIEYVPFLYTPHPDTPIYNPKSYSIYISVSSSSGGQVSCTPNPVDHGTDSSCIASPNEGFSFSHWEGDCADQSGPLCDLRNVTSEKNIEAIFIYTGEEHELINAAVLPYARAVAVNESATAFASVINNGLRDAINCKIQLPASIPASLMYQTTDANNILIGSPDTPVDIPVGATQGYVFGITPATALLSREIPLVFDCDNAYPAPSHIGLNTLILTATDSVPPDMLAIGATPSSDGVIRLTNTTETGFFATAAVNIGSGGTVTARADDGGKNLPVTLQLCETNSVGNLIICGNDLTRSVASGQTVYYTVFVTGTEQPISFDPANNRLFLRFSADGQTVGATNVAVTTD